MHFMQNPVPWKSETFFNLRLNNLRQDINNPKAIPAWNYFKTHVHDFMKHGEVHSNRTIKGNIKWEQRHRKTAAKTARRCLDH